MHEPVARIRPNERTHGLRASALAAHVGTHAHLAGVHPEMLCNQTTKENMIRKS